MTTNARIGYGTLLKMRTSTGPDVYTVLGEQTSLKGGGFTVNMVDATHEQSPSAWSEMVAGLVKAKDWVIGMNFVPGGTTQQLILSSLRALQTFRTVFPDGSFASFTGYFADSDPDLPIDSTMKDSITITPSGVLTVTAAAAPTNVLLPAISGTVQFNHVLTAFDGNWANEPTAFTYQWKLDGSNIGGATAKTYTPIVGDETHAISVVVTASNSAGSASATSAATVAVAA